MSITLGNLVHNKRADMSQLLNRNLNYVLKKLIEMYLFPILEKVIIYDFR